MCIITRKCDRFRVGDVLAEGMRFELTVRLDAVRRFSKPLPSATRPPLRRGRHRTAFAQVFYALWPGSSNCYQARLTANPRCTAGRAIIASYHRFTFANSSRLT